jgi:hypothetical protein
VLREFALVLVALENWLTEIAATAVSVAAPLTIVVESVVPSAVVSSAGAVVPMAMNDSDATNVGAETTTVHVVVARTVDTPVSFVVIVYT